MSGPYIDDCEELLDFEKECVERDKIAADKVHGLLWAFKMMSADYQSALQCLAEHHIYSDDADPGRDTLQETYIGIGKSYAKEASYKAREQ